ncbi:MAG: prephenate dehydrogenase [Helicobacteraceae bacterium]|jgi:prephenate dehydrogenase|nr:prephenate dehydrogenase [Helicobacteraceae bacterium]
MRQLGIVGVGLMGGSLALAARERKLFDSIVGCGRSDESLRTALELNIIDRALRLEELIASSDLIALAAPVETIVALIPQLSAAKQSAVFTDLGSTKTAIIRAILPSIRARFVAAHPMCGTEYSGPKAAFSSLYQDRIVVLCDTEANDKDALEAVERLFGAIGMKIVKMRSQDHDRHAAFISHLPHAISYALANSVLNQEDKQSILTLAAGGFRDMSRLAKSSASMWIDIFKQNKPALISAIGAFEGELKKAEKLLNDEDWEALKAWMRSANALHDIFKSS